MFNPNKVERRHVKWNPENKPITSLTPVVKASDYDSLLKMYKKSELELSKIGILYGVGPYAVAPHVQDGTRHLATIIEEQK
jgi:hypothetical protein